MSGTVGNIQKTLSDYQAKSDDLKYNALVPAIQDMRESASKLKPDLPMGEFKPVEKPKEEPGIPEDPMKLFANAGSALGVLLSFKARRPLVASMQALASAGEAINKNDYETYQKQMETWKEQNKLTLEQANNQNQIFSQVAKINEMDFNSRQAIVKSFEALGQIDSNTAKILLSGNDAILKHQDSMAHVGAQMANAVATRELKEQQQVQAIANRDPRVAAYLVENPGANYGQVLNAVNKIKADVSSVYGPVGFDFLRNFQPEAVNQFQETIRSGAKEGKVSPVVAKNVQENITFFEEGNVVSKRIMERPDAVGLLAKVNASIAPAMTAFKDAKPEERAEKYIELSDQAFKKLAQDNPEEFRDVGDAALVINKDIGALALKYARATAGGRPTVFLDRLTGTGPGGWFSPTVGVNALIGNIDILVKNSASELERNGYKMTNLTDEAKQKYNLYTQGADLFQREQSQRYLERQKDGARTRWEIEAGRLNPGMSETDISVQADLKFGRRQ